MLAVLSGLSVGAAQPQSRLAVSKPVKLVREWRSVAFIIFLVS
jgi:hypothetical protein